LFALLRKAVTLRMPWRLHVRLWRWMARSAVREFPWALGALAAAAIALLIIVGALGSTVGIIVVAALALAELVLARFAVQALRTAETLREALADLDADPGQEHARFPLSNVLFPLLMLWPRGVRRLRGVEFARDGRHALRLDVYMPADESSTPRPAVIQVHGGGWIVGSRLEQGIPLLNHLAASGWVGFNIDYRLSPRATFPEHVVDVKRAIAWVREHAAEYGADPDFICITGGSAGGHLSALAALTPGDPAFQPGFEDADTSVAAAVPFYGVYDLTNADGVYYPELRDAVLEPYVFKAKYADEPERFRDASPTSRVSPDAPPFLILHGDLDTLVPVADARRFAKTLREVSDNPVLYAELAGAEHAFDIVPSVRTARVVETIELFLSTVRDRTQTTVASVESIG
jgi:acetyl esterase/lipase